MARKADQIVNQYGAPIEGASVYVYDNTEQLAVLTEDGGGALSNPVTSDQYGNFHFNTDDGLYALSFHVGGVQIFRDEAVQVGSGPVLPAEILVALAQDGAAALIGTAQAQTVQAALDDLMGQTTDLETTAAFGVMYVESYRAAFVTDYLTVQAAIAAFIAAGGKGRLVWGKNRAYNYGTWNSGSPGAPNNIVLFPVLGLRLATLDFNGSTHTLTTSGVQAIVFYLYNYQGVVIQGLYCTDAGLTNGGDSTTGGKMVVLDADASNPSKDFTIRDSRAFNMNTFINVNSGTGGNRVKGIRIEGACVADTTFYGFTCQENGDDASGRLTCRNIGRAYLSYGGTGHDLDFYVEDTGAATPAAEACMVIKRKTLDSKGNRVRATFSGVLKWTVSLFDLEHEPLAANSVVDASDCMVNILKGYTDPNSIYAFAFRSRVDGTYEELAATFTGSITNGSATVSTLSIPIGNFIAGQGITGTGIPANTTVLTVGASTLTLSANATATNAAAVLTRLTKNVWSNIRFGGDIGALKVIKCFVGAITPFDIYLDGPLSALASTGFALQPGARLHRSGFNAGTKVLASGAATVAFNAPQPDTSYLPFLSTDANETIRWGTKTTAGFTITSSNGASTANVNWQIMRGFD